MSDNDELRLKIRTDFLAIDFAECGNDVVLPSPKIRIPSGKDICIK